MSKYPKIHNGFQIKSVYIKTIAGALRFNLQQVNELGLPNNAMILGIQTREHTRDITSPLNIPLVDTAIYDNAYLSLKDRNSPTGKIDLLIDQYRLRQLQRTEFIEPCMSQNIDWNQSFIQINPRVTAVDNQCFELLIYYADCENQEKWNNRLILRNGEEFSGERIASFDVALNDTQIQYALSNANNIGLPLDAYVLGFSTTYNDEPLYADRMDITAFNSGYITFKHGTCAFIDQYPINNTNYPNILGSTNYVPIKPTRVSDFDWQQSKLEIKGAILSPNGTSFNFSLYWWKDENC